MTGRRHGPAALATLALALVSMLCAPTAGAAPPGTAPRPRRPHAPFLLALGDSISFGFQTAKVGSPPDPAAFDTGYADVLAARDRRLRVVNYSCPGETTTTMIDGGALGAWRVSPSMTTTREASWPPR